MLMKLEIFYLTTIFYLFETLVEILLGSNIIMEKKEELRGCLDKRRT